MRVYQGYRFFASGIFADAYIKIIYANKETPPKASS
jgi:hypothetical protein